MLTPRSPDFIGIGAQKAGTSWLWANLRRHADIWMPPLKELHYFDQNLEEGVLPSPLVAERLNDSRQRVRSLYSFQRNVKNASIADIAWWALYEFIDRDDDWYRKLFSLAPSTSLVGEITPRYAICRDSDIQQMYRLAPAAKLLFILRHPVERFWSQCKMKHKDGSLTKDDPSAMKLFDSPNGRPRGEYSATIKNYCKYYDPSQILVIFQDGIIREPQAVMQRVLAFLGLSPLSLPDDILNESVNAASDLSPMPTSLRDRIAAAYREEMETLAEVFGGYASRWLEESPSVSLEPTIQLNQSHLDAIATRPARLRATRKHDPIKIFCLSMQRSGTTSIGDWLEAHGLKRVGSPTSVRLGWTRLWFEGRFEEIFNSPEFQNAEILEDDPWWCPRFHHYLAERFPKARFVMLTRDPDDWFDSLCHHSGGMNPGWTDVHAKVYEREVDLDYLLQNAPVTNPTRANLLSIVEHREHYKSIYLRHINNVKLAFANSPERLFVGELKDSNSFYDLCDFVGIKRNLKIHIPRSNARTEAMQRNLAVRLAESTL